MVAAGKAGKGNDVVAMDVDPEPIWGREGEDLRIGSRE